MSISPANARLKLQEAEELSETCNHWRGFPVDEGAQEVAVLGLCYKCVQEELKKEEMKKEEEMKL